MPSSLAAILWSNAKALNANRPPGRSEAATRSNTRRSSPLKLALREVRDRETGMTLNAVREAIEQAFAARQEVLERAELEAKLSSERADVTLPADLLGP